ncbi:hypothetical protein A2U01_0084083, partial [Trifolium medium]|nr:hypothetical protein [Trifolium medium]
ESTCSCVVAERGLARGSEEIADSRQFSPGNPNFLPCLA